MRFSVAAAYLSACLAPVAGLVFPNSHWIDGDSPLEYCPGPIFEEYIKINRVDIAPNPPAAGRDLVIHAKGTVKKTIEEGAFVKVLVKLGIVTLINLEEDLCKQVTNIDLKCPIKPGEIEFKKTVTLPQQIPPTPIFVQADVLTKNHRNITCLSATIAVKPASFLFNLEL